MQCARVHWCTAHVAHVDLWGLWGLWGPGAVDPWTVDRGAAGTCAFLGTWDSWDMQKGTSDPASGPW